MKTFLENPNFSYWIAIANNTWKSKAALKKENPIVKNTNEKQTNYILVHISIGNICQKSLHTESTVDKGWLTVMLSHDPGLLPQSQVTAALSLELWILKVWTVAIYSVITLTSNVWL